MDRSWNLLQIAKHAGSEPAALVTREVVWGDVLGNGWRAGAFVSLERVLRSKVLITECLPRTMLYQ